MRILLLAILALGCATPPAPPMPRLPPPADLGKLLPPAPDPLRVPLTVRRYEDQRVRAGQCPGLPPGILVSPAVYAEQLIALSDRKRLVIETAALHRLYAEERQIAEGLEQAYQARLLAMQAREGTLVWRVMAVFGAGVVLGWLASVAVGRPVPITR